MFSEFSRDEKLAVTMGKAKDPEKAAAALTGKVKRRKGEKDLPEHTTGGSHVDVNTQRHLANFFMGGANGKVSLCVQFEGKITGEMMRDLIIPLLPAAIRAAWRKDRTAGHGAERCTTVHNGAQKQVLADMYSLPCSFRGDGARCTAE